MSTAEAEYVAQWDTFLCTKSERSGHCYDKYGQKCVAVKVGEQPQV